RAKNISEPCAQMGCRPSTRGRTNLRGGKSRCPITSKTETDISSTEVCEGGNYHARAYCYRSDRPISDFFGTGVRYPRQLHDRRNRTASGRLRCGRRCRSGIHWQLFRGRQGRSERCLRTTTLNCRSQLSVGCSLWSSRRACLGRRPSCGVRQYQIQETIAYCKRKPPFPGGRHF